MRAAPIALPLFLLAAPVMAQAPHPHPSAADAARALQSPIAQDAAAAYIDQLVDIVLDTRVGPVAALSDPRDGVRSTDTLRDLKRRDDPAFERHLHEGTRHAVGTAAAVAGGAAVESAELKRTAARLQAALGPLVAALAGDHGGE